jgi:hypothetical protein
VLAANSQSAPGRARYDLNRLMVNDHGKYKDTVVFNARHFNYDGQLQFSNGKMV